MNSCRLFKDFETRFHCVESYTMREFLQNNITVSGTTEVFYIRKYSIFDYHLIFHDQQNTINSFHHHDIIYDKSKNSFLLNHRRKLITFDSHGNQHSLLL